MRKYSGVVEQKLREEYISYLDNSSPVITKNAAENDSESSTGMNLVYQVKETLPSLEGGHKVIFFMKESLHYVRPMHHFTDRLEYISKKSSSVKFLVSKFGLPAPNVTIHMYKVGSEVIPSKGVTVLHDTAQTTDSRHVTLTFEVREEIPEKRYYTRNLCTKRYRQQMYHNSSHIQNNNSNETVTLVLPIDGQMYFLYYCADADSNTKCTPPEIEGDPLTGMFYPTLVTM